MNKFLFKHIDNSALIVFRMCFGFLIFMESAGAMMTGWLRRTLIEPQFTFNFIGFDWLQPLPGNWMYVYFSVMALSGILVMIGFKYRWAMLTFGLMWAAVYLMQKSSYNNHYYFLMLLNAFMFILPANRYASVDAHLDPKLKSISMPNWCRWIFIIQLFILYTYASIAKLYPDWLDTSVPELLMKSKRDYFLVGELLQEKFMHYLIAYGGILFDGLIIPLLLWKRTRPYAFFISIFFHLFNSFIFQVGIFPYLSLSFSLFFFEPNTIRKIFLRNKPAYTAHELEIPKYHQWYVSIFVIYFIIQIGLPLRHHFFEDNVLWTEEGHRLSWRMMLRAKSGSTTFTVVDKATKKSTVIRFEDYLSSKQTRTVSSKPDVMWQFAQRLKRSYAENGQDVAVYVRAYVSVNGRPTKLLIDPKVDLANEEWHPFKHHTWLNPSNLNEDKPATTVKH